MPAPPEGVSDGFGQGLWQDFRLRRAARRLRKQAIVWQAPSSTVGARLEADPFFREFADFIVGIACVGNVACIVMERLYAGWPDPPRYAVFGVRCGAIIAAGDFNEWPAAWDIPQANGGR